MTARGAASTPSTIVYAPALARLVLADPHTLVLDEGTSLLDLRAARHLERALGSALTGRTVVAIALRRTPRTTPTGWRWSRTAC
jgi:ABC-type transport system involved in cytochrome c biogenesis ATPase subunit